VVPAVLVDELSATPLLWVQPLDRQGLPEGEPLVCADGTRMAGPGQMIYWVASREAALTLDPTFVPVDDAIVGLVDDVRLYPREAESE
jgi:ethanolamine utilization protein EutN